MIEKNFDEKYTGKNVIEKKLGEKNPAKKLVELFRTTQDHFDTGQLCAIKNHYSEDPDSNDQPKRIMHYCGVGECLKEVGIECNTMAYETELDNVINILVSKANANRDLEEDELSEARIQQGQELRQKLIDRFGIDFKTQYKNKLHCCYCVYDHIIDLEILIIHGNDKHSHNFKDLAEYINIMSEIYNLETGEKIINE